MEQGQAQLDAVGEWDGFEVTGVGRVEAFVPAILAHAEAPPNTSLIDGINNKIKIITRIAFGVRDNVSRNFEN